MQRIVASLCASLLALGLLAGPTLGGRPSTVAIFSYAAVTLTNDAVWPCEGEPPASAQIETGFVIGDLLMRPGTDRPAAWMDADIRSFVVLGCEGARWDWGPGFSGDLTGWVTTDQMAIEPYESAVLDLDGVAYFDENWEPTSVWATFDLAWEATGEPTTLHGTEANGADRNAPASVTGTVTIHGMPVEFTFVADAGSEAWLGREVQVMP